MRTTHTYATLAVKPSTLLDIRTRIEDLNARLNNQYAHLLTDVEGGIILPQIALVAEEQAVNPFAAALEFARANAMGVDERSSIVLSDLAAEYERRFG